MEQTVESLARFYMWLCHGCDGNHRYGDDGEMQCCGLDFRRMSVFELHSRIQDLKILRAVQAERQK